jgi:hypothetical protein
MATLSVSFTLATPTPALGYLVQYRIKGSGGSYTTLSPNPTSSPAIIPGLLNDTEYEGIISSACEGGGFSTTVNFTTCTCQSGYTATADNESCEKVETAAATVDVTDYCITSAREASYSAYTTRIYNSGFHNATIIELTATTYPSDVFAEVFLPEQWTSIDAMSGNPSASLGPMNRSGIWLDSDCDGTKDPVVNGTVITIGTVYINPDPAKTIYIGVGGDNAFDIVVEGVHVATSPNSVSALSFNIWHVFPVVVKNGSNYINLIATSAGGVDGVGMTIYNNTAAEIEAATDDSQLDIPFSTQSLRGTHVNIATCPSTYTLTGGIGSYICRRTLIDTCNGV